MGKPSGDEQKVHTRPTGWDELAQHSEVPSFSSAGKWDAWVVEDKVLTWGYLSGYALRASGERPPWRHEGRPERSQPKP